MDAHVRLLAASLFSPEVLTSIVVLVRLGAASRLATTHKSGHVAVRALVGMRLGHLSRWASGIWVDGPAAIRDAALKATAPGLPRPLHSALLDALTHAAQWRNRRPLRVAVLCYTKPPKRSVAVRFEFLCPRRHGALSEVRGVPTQYCLRHSSDDLIISCANCDRGQFQSESGGLGCLNCTAGTISEDQGASKCTLCVKGSYTPIEGLSACVECAEGTYQSLVGGAKCHACPERWAIPGGTPPAVGPPLRDAPNGPGEYPANDSRWAPSA